jgi:hypothetical protein
MLQYEYTKDFFNPLTNLKGGTNMDRVTFLISQFEGRERGLDFESFIEKPNETILRFTDCGRTVDFILPKEISAILQFQNLDKCNQLKVVLESSSETVLRFNDVDNGYDIKLPANIPTTIKRPYDYRKGTFANTLSDAIRAHQAPWTDQGGE